MEMEALRATIPHDWLSTVISLVTASPQQIASLESSSASQSSKRTAPATKPPSLATTKASTSKPPSPPVTKALVPGKSAKRPYTESSFTTADPEVLLLEWGEVKAEGKTVKKPRTMLTDEVISYARFWVLDVGLNMTVAAALREVNYDALAKSLDREKECRVTFPVSRSPGQLNILKERVDRVIAALMRQNIVKKLARKVRLDVLIFPGNNHSEVHLQALLALFKGATATIGVSMYVITPERIVKELLAANTCDRVVRGVVDTQELC